MDKLWKTPASWQWSTLGQIASWGSGGTPTSSVAEYYNGDIPWLVIGDLNDGNVSNAAKSITPEGLESSSAKLVKRGSVLIAMYGSIGKLGIADIECTTNQAIAFTKEISPAISNKYLFYYLLSIRGFLNSLGKGGNQSNISQTVLKKVPIPIPPRQYVDKVVSELEIILSNVNLLSKRLKKIPHLLKRFRQTILSSLNEYEKRSIGELITDIKYGTSKKSEKDIKGVPILRIPNIGDGVIIQDNLKYALLENKEFHSLKLIEGDLLLIRSNGSVNLLGRTALVSKNEENYAYAGYLMRIRVDRRLILPEYLNLMFKSLDVREQIEIPSRSSSGVNNINTSEVKNLQIPLPPLDNQEEIINRVEKLFKLADQLEERYRKAKAYVDKLPQSVLAKAFRGKLTN